MRLSQMSGNLIIATVQQCSVISSIIEGRKQHSRSQQGSLTRHKQHTGFRGEHEFAELFSESLRGRVERVILVVQRVTAVLVVQRVTAAGGIGRRGDLRDRATRTSRTSPISRTSPTRGAVSTRRAAPACAFTCRGRSTTSMRSNGSVGRAVAHVRRPSFRVVKRHLRVFLQDFCLTGRMIIRNAFEYA